MIDAPVRTHHDAAHARLMEEDQQRTLAEHVNSLLAQWHAWSSGHSMVHGYPTINTTCRVAQLAPVRRRQWRAGCAH